jgi:hypothetical protein
MAGWLARVRADMAQSISVWQREGRVRDDVSAEGIAVLTAALMDGLIFHGLIDPQLDLAEVARTLDATLSTIQPKERN